MPPTALVGQPLQRSQSPTAAAGSTEVTGHAPLFVSLVEFPKFPSGHTKRRCARGWAGDVKVAASFGKYSPDGCKHGEEQFAVAPI